jgi:cell wall-associated NlpC family hydrolase
MIIKRSIFFITITLLFLFPWVVCGEATKNLSQKHSSTTSKKTHKGAKKKGASSKLKAKKESKKPVRSQKRNSKQVARENPVKAKDAPPLLKITPLEDGKFLLEPIDSSRNTEQGNEALSLIKKPVFEEEGKLEESKEGNQHSLVSFSNLLVDVSKQLIGKTYRLGGNGTGDQGIDCSGFMKRIYKTFTLSLPHNSREQAKLGSLVTTEWDLNRLKIGDLLFFKRSRGSQIGHTGMYIGDGKMIHSASKKGVVISNLKGSDYYNRNFVMAKRLFILDKPESDEFKEFKEPQGSQLLN